HAAFVEQMASSARFAGIVYAVTGEFTGYPIFKAHIQKALAGTGGYPTGLSQYGIQARMDADPDQDADAYFDDIMSLLRGVEACPASSGTRTARVPAAPHAWGRTSCTSAANPAFGSCGDTTPTAGTPSRTASGSRNRSR